MGAWQDTLSKAGVYVEIEGPFEVGLIDGNHRVQAALFASRTPLTPAKVDNLDPGPGLLVVPRATDAVIARAFNRGWAVVTENGRADLRGVGIEVNIRPEGRGSATHLRRGPAPWRSMTILRRLISAVEPVSQWRLAQLAQVSQPHVHRTLQPWIADGLVRQWHSGVIVERPSDAVEWWIARYPGPGGTRSYWTSLDPVTRQAEKVVSLSNWQPNPPQTDLDPDVATKDPSPVLVAISGDAAADLISPWRHPQQAIVYAASPPPLSKSGLVPSASAEEASLVLVAPADPGVWLPRPWSGMNLPVADPLQVLWDLKHAPGTDSVDAYEHLKADLLGPLRPLWATASGHLPK